VYTSGYAFPRRRGGPMFYADELGLDTVLAGLEKYGKIGNPKDWKPAALLKQLAESGSTFAAWAESKKG
jgi:3-hydroxyacyl-CoA dehydrogenase